MRLGLPRREGRQASLASWRHLHLPVLPLRLVLHAGEGWAASAHQRRVYFRTVFSLVLGLIRQTSWDWFKETASQLKNEGRTCLVPSGATREKKQTGKKRKKTGREGRERERADNEVVAIESKQPGQEGRIRQRRGTKGSPVIVALRLAV